MKINVQSYKNKGKNSRIEQGLHTPGTQEAHTYNPMQESRLNQQFM